MQNLLLSLHIISPKFIPLYRMFLFSEEKTRVTTNKVSGFVSHHCQKRHSLWGRKDLDKIWSGPGKEKYSECGKILP